MTAQKKKRKLPQDNNNNSNNHNKTNKQTKGNTYVFFDINSAQQRKQLRLDATCSADSERSLNNCYIKQKISLISA